MPLVAILDNVVITFDIISRAIWVEELNTKIFS
jgi:hypothetical protein